jgi:hypothetical protein
LLLHVGSYLYGIRGLVFGGAKSQVVFLGCLRSPFSRHDDLVAVVVVIVAGRSYLYHRRCCYPTPLHEMLWTFRPLAVSVVVMLQLLQPFFHPAPSAWL